MILIWFWSWKRGTNVDFQVCTSRRFSCGVRHASKALFGHWDILEADNTLYEGFSSYLSKCQTLSADYESTHFRASHSQPQKRVHPWAITIPISQQSLRYPESGNLHTIWWNRSWAHRATKFHCLFGNWTSFSLLHLDHKMLLSVWLLVQVPLILGSCWAHLQICRGQLSMLTRTGLKSAMASQPQNC